MAARFIDTGIWGEDWFCELGGEYQLFWIYITNQCNNAGIWKPNKIDFEIKSRTKINVDAFLTKVNERGRKDRIIITDSGRWFLTGFIAFQWFNKTKFFDLVLSNKLHKHIVEILVKEQVKFENVRGLKEVLKRSGETSKDKDNILYKSKYIENNNSIYGGLEGVLKGSKSLERKEEKKSAKKEEKFPFEGFWNLYGKKVGREKAEKKWNRLKVSEKEAAMRKLPEYVQSTPDKQYRKHPCTWLNQKGWEDEIIKSKSYDRDKRNESSIGRTMVFDKP